MILTLLLGLLPSYENFVQCFRVNKSFQDIDLDDIVAALVSKEKIRSKWKTSDKEVQDEQIFHIKAMYQNLSQKMCWNNLQIPYRKKKQHQ